MRLTYAQHVLFLIIYHASMGVLLSRKLVFQKFFFGLVPCQRCYIFIDALSMLHRRRKVSESNGDFYDGC